MVVVVNCGLYTTCAYSTIEYYTNVFESLAVKLTDFLLYPKWTDIYPCRWPLQPLTVTSNPNQPV